MVTPPISLGTTVAIVSQVEIKAFPSMSTSQALLTDAPVTAPFRSAPINVPTTNAPVKVPSTGAPDKVLTMSTSHAEQILKIVIAVLGVLGVVLATLLLLRNN
jgi:hypothetical protein